MFDIVLGSKGQPLKSELVTGSVCQDWNNYWSMLLLINWCSKANVAIMWYKCVVRVELLLPWWRAMIVVKSPEMKSVRRKSKRVEQVDLVCVLKSEVVKIWFKQKGHRGLFFRMWGRSGVEEQGTFKGSAPLLSNGFLVDSVTQETDKNTNNTSSIQRARQTRCYNHSGLVHSVITLNALRPDTHLHNLLNTALVNNWQSVK